MIIDTSNIDNLFLTKKDINSIKTKEPLIIELRNITIDINQAFEILKTLCNVFKVTIPNDLQINFIPSDSECFEYIVDKNDKGYKIISKTDSIVEKVKGEYVTKEDLYSDETKRKLNILNVLSKNDIFGPDKKILEDIIPTLGIESIRNLSNNLNAINNNINAKADKAETTATIKNLKTKVDTIADDDGVATENFLNKSSIPSSSTVGTLVNDKIQKIGVITDDTLESKLQASTKISNLNTRISKVINSDCDFTTTFTEAVNTNVTSKINGMGVVTSENFDSKLDSSSKISSIDTNINNMGTRLNKVVDVSGNITPTLQQKTNYVKCETSSESGKEWYVDTVKLENDERDSKVFNRLYKTTQKIIEPAQSESCILKCNGEDITETSGDAMFIVNEIQETSRDHFKKGDREWSRTFVLNIIETNQGEDDTNIYILNDKGYLCYDIEGEYTKVEYLPISTLVKYLNAIKKLDSKFYDNLTIVNGYDPFDKINLFLNNYYNRDRQRILGECVPQSFENMMNEILLPYGEKFRYDDFIKGTFYKYDENKGEYVTYGPMSTIKQNAKNILIDIKEYHNKFAPDDKWNDDLFNIIAFLEEPVSFESNVILVDSKFIYPVHINIDNNKKPVKKHITYTYIPKKDAVIGYEYEQKTSTYGTNWKDNGITVAFITDRYTENEQTYWHVEYRKFVNGDWLESGEENLISETEPTEFESTSEFSVISERLSSIRDLVNKNKIEFLESNNNIIKLMNGEEVTIDGSIVSNKLSRIMNTFTNEGSINPQFGVSKGDWSSLVDAMNDASGAITTINTQINTINTDLSTHNTSIENLKTASNNNVNAINQLINKQTPTELTPVDTTPTTERTFDGIDVDTNGLVKKTII